MLAVISLGFIRSIKQLYVLQCLGKFLGNAPKAVTLLLSGNFTLAHNHST